MSKWEGIECLLKKLLATPVKNFIRHAGLEQDATEGTEPVPKTLKHFSVPLAEHCNLRCCGCDHFAPLAEQEFADIGAFENDFARLSHLLNGDVEKIGLMGGEPLL